MEYEQIKVSRNGKVGVITLDHAPRNSMSKRMMLEMVEAFNEFERDNDVRAILVNSTGKHFSQGADADDIHRALTGTDLIPQSLSELGNMIVAKIDFCPKPTMVAARGDVIGGSTAIFNAFDIRVVSETFCMHDGDIYYGTVGSWGMSSLRLPLYIGRNKMMDYMFLNEHFTARQCYELGLVSKVFSDDVFDEASMKIAQKLATAAPLAVKAFKECVREAVYNGFDAAHAKEQQVAIDIMKTEDSKKGLAAVIRGEQAEFEGK